MPARLRTPICDLFGIDVPIILAGLGGVSMAPLVAAVSNEGGLGVIGAANLAPEELRAEIRRVRALTDRPFGVDLLAPLPQMLLPHLPVLYDEGVPVFVAGLAVPEAEVPEMKRHGLKIMVMTGRVKHAQRAEAAGAGVVAALALGAQGVVIGTRFIATPEATAARQYREALVAAKQDDTVRTRCYS